MRLSESYLSAEEKYGEGRPDPDLDVVVHVYDFRMTLDEVLRYIEQGVLPECFGGYDSNMRNYALVANGITYMQRTENAGYTVPVNVSTVANFLQLMLDRGIFVDLLSDKEVCDMTMAQFSRDDILIYQGLEEGLEKGLEKGREEGLEKGREEGVRAFILDKVEDGVSESIIIEKLHKHFALDENTARQYYRTYVK